MQNYASAYRGAYTDKWSSEAQHGFASKEKYDEHKNKMLKSVYEHGGFWISQYEIGYEETTIRTEKTDDTGLVQKPVSKEGACPYNWVTCKQAQKLATQMGMGEYTSSLMFGIQWDLALKHLEAKGNWNTNEHPSEWYLKTDSNSWGNYYNPEFAITKGKYSIDYGKNFIIIQQSGYKKSLNTPVLLTTGASDRNCCLNIYDLAGNVYEWTLEKTTTADQPCSQRGRRI